MKSPKILVIDDEEYIRIVLKEILEFYKYVVYTADSGIKGLEIFQNNDFDIVLLDIKMPEMDGIEVLEKIKEIDVSVEVIIITGHSDEDIAIQCLKHGAFDYLRKPIDSDELLISIERGLEKQQIAQKLKLLHNAVSNSVDGVIIFDLDDKILFVNDAHSKMYGYSKNELIGNDIKIFYSKTTLIEEYHTIKQKIMETGSWVGEVEVKKKNGDLIPVLIASSLVLKDNGKPFAIISINRDITERKKFEQQLKEYSEQLEQKVIERTKELYEKTKKLELQMQIKTVLTNVIPLLVASAPATNRNMFIKEMCNQVEGVLWNKYLSKFKEVDRNILGNCLCKIMNELGGKFEVHKILDKKLFIKGTVCPWDMEAKRNPVLCMLCKCIFSRLAVKVFNKVIIDLNKTLGNKDEHCLIIISEY